MEVGKAQYKVHRKKKKKLQGKLQNKRNRKTHQANNQLLGQINWQIIYNKKFRVHYQQEGKVYTNVLFICSSISEYFLKL